MKPLNRNGMHLTMDLRFQYGLFRLRESFSKKCRQRVSLIINQRHLKVVSSILTRGSGIFFPPKTGQMTLMMTSLIRELCQKPPLLVLNLSPRPQMVRLVINFDIDDR